MAGMGTKCAKGVLFFFNFLVFVVGGAATAAGIYTMVSKSSDADKLDALLKLDNFETGLMHKGAIVLIAAGSFLFLLGFFGCCGAVTENRCFLGLYAAIVIVIVLAQAAAAGLTIAFWSKIKNELQKALTQAIHKNYDGRSNSTNSFSLALDYAQVKFECCGVSDPLLDFNGTAWKNTTGRLLTVPETCCAMNDTSLYLKDRVVILKNPKCVTESPSKDNANTGTTCFDSIKDLIVKNAPLVIGIALGTLVIEILAVVFACCLMRAIAEDE